MRYDDSGRINPNVGHDRFDRDELRQRFTDRAFLLEAFERNLSKPPPVPVLVFFGLGGSGKTYLIHYLRQRYCYNWQDSPQGNPGAYISFRPGHTNADPLHALWSLRSQFRRDWTLFSFPRFDLVWGKLWERIYHLPIEKNTTLLPDDVKWISSLLEAVELVPVLGEASKAIKLFLNLGGMPKEWFGQHQVANWFVENLEEKYKTNWKLAFQTIDIDELQLLSAKAFSRDLADSTAPIIGTELNQTILFVDTYEYLQEQSGEVHGKESVNFIQTLAEALLRHNANVQLIIAGKNKLHWAERRLRNGTWNLDAASFWAQGVSNNESNQYTSTYLEQYQVENFSEPESLLYIQRRGLSDKTIAGEIYQLTQGFPLGLSTAVDLVEEAAAGASDELAVLRSRVVHDEAFSKQWREELSGWLLERLLEQLLHRGENSLVGLLRAAAIPRWFNEDMLFHLVGSYDLQEQFNRLLSYSFVEAHDISQGPSRPQIFRLHPTARTLLRQSIRIKAQREEWELAAMKYFQILIQDLPPSDQQFAYEVEALYHKSNLSLKEGIQTGDDLFERELGRYNVGRCEAILQALREVEGWSASEQSRLLTLSGRLYMRSAAFDLAIQQFRKAEKLQPLILGFARHRFAIVENLAQSLRLSGEYAESMKRWEQIRRLGVEQNDPRIQYFAAWGESLTYNLVDNLPRSLRLCNETAKLLETIRRKPELMDHVSFREKGLDLKLANLNRHKALILRYMGDYAEAQACCEYFSAVYEDQSVVLERYYGLTVTANLLRLQGNYERSKTLAQEALAGFEELAEPRGRVTSAWIIGIIAYLKDEYREAEDLFQLMLAIPARTFPDGLIYGNLGMAEIARQSGNLDKAKQYYQTSINLCSDYGGKVGIAYGQLGIAEIARQANETETVLSLVKRIDATGTICKHPWLQVYANLIGASATAGRRQSVFLARAKSAVARFRYGKNDNRLEENEIVKLQTATELGKSIGPFRLNFP